MELTPHAEVFERAAPTYDRVGVEFFSTFGRRLVSEAGVAAGESVLDVGTGRGAVLGPAAAAVGPGGRVIGVDLSPAMVDLTAEEFAASDHVEVRQADAAAMPTELGTFDAVLSSLVLFFTDEPAGTLEHWASFVAQEGRLGLVTFLADADDAWFRTLLQAWLPPQETAPGDSEASSFDLVRNPAWLDRALAEVGLGQIEASTLRHPVHFDDVDHWWTWVWSHGARAGLEQVPADKHEAFKAAAGEALDAPACPMAAWACTSPSASPSPAAPDATGPPNAGQRRPQTPPNAGRCRASYALNVRTSPARPQTPRAPRGS